jgi:serine/threonine protein kinase
MDVSHNSILVPLAMWRQRNFETDDKFYMLYPKAKCNLKDHLRTYRKTPRLNKKFIEHLMLQLWNLADALVAIHLLSKRSALGEDHLDQLDVPGGHNRPTRPSLHPSSAETRPQKAAYHHDLKPENILVFDDDDTWKISDFGTAGVTQAISGKSIFEVTEVQAGDPNYSPPDLALGRHTGRAYDVWCFGCILLEILLTIFQDNTPDHLDEMDPDDPAPHRLDQFYRDRADSVPGVRADGKFWYKKNDGSCELRQPVLDRFNMLRRRTRDHDQFEELTELAKSMLEVDASKRPSAEKVAARMRKIREQIMHNLKMKEDFYLVAGSVAQPWASRQTTEGGSQVSSPRTTDNISSGIPSIQTRQQSTPEQQRVRRFGSLLESGGPSNSLNPTYEMAMAGTLTTPMIQVVQYPDNISLRSDEEEDTERSHTRQPSIG